MKTEYSTEDEGPKGVSAGKLDEYGFTFRFMTLTAHEGTYRNKHTGEIQPFYTAEGTVTDDDGTRDFSLVFGSKKLRATMEKVRADYPQGVKINVSGYGEGFDRNYKVRIV